jgi:hypothetical protein
MKATAQAPVGVTLMINSSSTAESFEPPCSSASRQRPTMAATGTPSRRRHSTRLPIPEFAGAHVRPSAGKSLPRKPMTIPPCVVKS